MTPPLIMKLIPIYTLLLSALFTLYLTAAERVALIIGNNAYQHGSPLSNCVNDARSVAASLKECGFEVIVMENSALKNMEDKLREFKKSATGAKAAWFYYAGHGAEVAGANYLIPVDAKVETEYEVKHKTLPLDLVLGALDEAGTPLKVVVLDSCRDNPFGRNWKRTGSAGLAAIGASPEGTIIAYATSPGKVAADGKGLNSPYTTALITALAKPGLGIDAIFRETGRTVQELTGGVQNPWINLSFYGDFVLRPGAVGSNPAPSRPAPAAPLAAPPLANAKIGDKYTLKLPGGAEMTFCYCPPGSFTMGSPKSEQGRTDKEDQAQVRLSRGFWLARTELTQDQWQAVMGNNPSEFKGAKLPVETVNWEDILKFLEKLNAAGGLPEGWKWALPTEAQWEYACRAGTTTTFSFGESLSSRQANFNGNHPYGSASKGPYTGETNTVGSYAANAWGLNDMHGNVYEWCGDWHAKVLEGGVDPMGPLTGVRRVIRGGSMLDKATDCRAAYRLSVEPSDRRAFLGFRPALVPLQ